MKKPPYKFSGNFLKTRICCWLLTAWCLLDFEVSGEVTIRIIETAVGVEIDGEGSINVEGLKLKDEMTIDSIQNPLLGSLDFAVAKGNEMNLLDVYFGLSGPPKL